MEPQWPPPLLARSHPHMSTRQILADLIPEWFAVLRVFPPRVFCACAENQLLASFRRLSHAELLVLQAVCRFELPVTIPVSKGSACLFY